MIERAVERTVCVILSVIFAFSAGAFLPGGTGLAAVDPQSLTPLSSYPGVKEFDFSIPPERGNVAEDLMVDPDYCIRLSKQVPDEYFGASVSRMKDSVSGQNVDGIMLANDGVKGECGCIYRRMFQYRSNWVDVKTTYMDWSVYLPRNAFMAGGFAHHRWRSLWWVEMKHEFFVSGTDTPINVMGFLEYDDVDNSQGIYLDPNQIGDIWVNSAGTSIGYKNIPGGVQYAQNDRASYVVDRDMLCIQSMTNDDIPVSGEPGYSALNAARTCFAFTFSGSTLYSCMVDDDTQGFNILDVSDSKHIPSALPDEDSAEIGKDVSDGDETGVTSNSVRSWEGWSYRIRVLVPPETEPGNFYDSFCIRDRIDSDLTVSQVRICRGEDEDVTELFDVSTADNLVTAAAYDPADEDFYGHEYFMYIDVSLEKTKEEMIREEKLDDDFRCTFLNRAEALYSFGNEQENISTNETDTTVTFELEADVIIRKEIRAEDNYIHHGRPTFVFRLQGTSVSGKYLTYNACVTIPSGAASGTLAFRNVPEGEYSCSEYETLRFEPEGIRDVTGGRISGNSVIFKIDSRDERRATFMNRKKNWFDYSDSNVVVNRIGIN